MYLDIDSKTMLSNKSQGNKAYKRFVVFTALLSILIWGTSFLLRTIDNFNANFTIQTIEDVKIGIQNVGLDSEDVTIKPHFASPRSKSNNLGGKLPFTKKVYDEHTLVAKLHDVQWTKEPQSIYNDRGTYILEEDKDGNEYRVVVKSIVDDAFEHTLINQSTINYDGIEYKIEEYIVSPDLQKVILKTNVSSTWRHSSLALYWILTVETKEVNSLYTTTTTNSSSGDDDDDDDDDSKNVKISAVAWSPDSRNIAFILNNNIYLKNVQSGETTQVTNDGSAEIFNGKPDWVYEEEVFSDDIVLWWSPNSDKIAFLKSNNTEVPEYTLPLYAQDKFADYPEVVKIKYPKAGYPNPIVDVLTYDLKKGIVENHLLKSSRIGFSDRLITEVVWIGDKLLVKTSNRASDLLEVFLVGEKSVNLVRSHEAVNSWFEVTSHTLYVPKNKTLGRKHDGYVDTVVVNGYNHLAYFSPADNPEYQLLTKGEWEVIDGVGAFDYNRNIVYFTSTMKSAIERHVHSIDLLDRTNNGLPYIKDITTKEGYYSSSFSSGARFLFLTDLGPEVPTQRINDLKLGKNVKTIEDNSALVKKLRDYELPQVNYGTVELTDEETGGGKFYVNSMETLPPNFDKRKKYPVLFFVYGGPGSQQVNKRWSLSFSSVVAAELDAVVVTIDGRGTGFNNLNYKMGSQFKFIVRDKLGKYEPIDVINAGRVWAKKSYVDPERMAVWGWSYGGFLTLKTLETDVEKPVFNYGVAIAPVTRWNLYDSIYTERYLRTPQENPQGYQTGSIHNYTNFKHVRKFFIGHGSGDDNVHMQHSLQLLDEFNLAEIENFEFMIFPDSNHAMSYHNGNKVVYDRILNFLERAFEWEFV
ncbi:DAPB [Candida oxycetoniae]|uniref:DAPB n=1 Tax=Candida oxycetoniae TaxID=497107 RepID=A0AAI9WYB3_9ASCO|nr:DAPB [Candida oxycetoniae]KAI3404849.2 DAPB [Candida oxycetoniae]